MPVILLFRNSDGDVVQQSKLVSSLSVGRSDKVDISIKDELLSSIHGHFEKQADGRVIYTDHHSKNGSYLNGALTLACQLRMKDCLRLGATEISIDEKALNRDERHVIGLKKMRKMKDLTLLKEFKKRQKREGTTKVFIRFRS